MRRETIFYLKNLFRQVFTIMLAVIFLATVILLVLKFSGKLVLPNAPQQQHQSHKNVLPERVPAYDEPTSTHALEIVEMAEAPNGPPFATSAESPSSNEPLILSPDSIAPAAPSLPPQDLMRKSCVSNLRVIFDAAVRVSKKTKPNLLPVDLMEIRTEFTNASVLLCPRELPSINSSLDWESFDPKLISYPVHGDLLSGAKVAKPGIDYRYLICPTHKIMISGNRNLMNAFSTNFYFFPHR